MQKFLLQNRIEKKVVSEILRNLFPANENNFELTKNEFLEKWENLRKIFAEKILKNKIKKMTPHLQTFFLSLTPLLELRVSIPVGHLKLGVPLFDATLISIFGGLILAKIAIFLLPIAIQILQKWKFFNKILQKIFARTRKKHSKKMAILGEFFLVIFVAVPLPGSGSATAALIAYLFGLSKKLTIFLISIGVFLSGILVAALTFFGEKIWNFFIF